VQETDQGGEEVGDDDHEDSLSCRECADGRCRGDEMVSDGLEDGRNEEFDMIDDEESGFLDGQSDCGDVHVGDVAKKISHAWIHAGRRT